jgi:hypothetical protein
MQQIKKWPGGTAVCINAADPNKRFEEPSEFIVIPAGCAKDSSKWEWHRDYDAAASAAYSLDIINEDRSNWPRSIPNYGAVQ